MRLPRLIRMLWVPLAFFGGTAGASWVTVDSVNCRTMPTPAATIVERLTRGQEVRRIRTQGEWSFVQASSACWVASRFLSDGQIGTVQPATARGGALSAGSSASARPVSVARATTPARIGQVSRARPTTSTRARSTRSRRGRGGGSYGVNCPCSGSNICVGPRGGRYCITSGGNKRYGV